MSESKYTIINVDGQYQIATDDGEQLQTPYGTVYRTPSFKIATQIIADLEAFGYDSYQSGFSSLCYAFTLNNLIENNFVDSVREEMIALPIDTDCYFLPATRGLPPARMLWDAQFVDDNRPDEVRQWIKRLNPSQLAATLTILCTTDNLNMAYLFAKAIEDDNEGLVTDIGIIYDHLLTSEFDSGQIGRLYQMFELLYKSE